MNKFVWSFSVGVLLSSNLVAAEPVKSGVEDQKAVAVTVYNNGLGLVKDQRKVQLPAGQGELQFMDVASAIQPVTVSARSISEPDKFRILEQNYEYDLMNQEKVLDKFVGKNIKIVQWKEYQDRKDVVDATLLSNEGQIFKVGDEIYLGYPGTKVVPEIPENLISKPTLMWQVENEGAQTQDLEVSYLTSGISWVADYVMLVDAQDKTADLSGWVTIENHSGATYKEAKLKVVAGQVNRVMPKAYPRADARMVMSMEAGAPAFEERGFFEYHVYDLQRPTTIKNNQTKQLSLLEASGIGVTKEYLLRADRSYYFQSFGGQDLKQPVEVIMNVMNTADNHLGMPLPRGTVRLYKKDTDGSQLFVGEDAIEHTPKDEKVRLKVGEAFDLVAERKQTDFRQVTSKDVETEWEIKLKNHKDEDVVIGVLEPLTGDWKILSSTHEFKKEDAFSMRTDVTVPKNGEVTVKYRVTARY